MSDTLIEGYRLSPQQARAFLQAQGGSAAFRSVCAVRIRGRLETLRLRRALEGLVANHEILRTSFLRLPDERLPLQAVASTGAVSLSERDGSGVQEADRELAIQTLFAAEREAERVEDTVALAARLVHLSPEDHVLLWSLPVLRADAATLEVLVGEMAQRYGGVSSSDYDEPVQYADVAEWLHTLLVSEETDAGRDYWRRQDDAPLSNIHLPYVRRSAAPAPFTPRYLSVVLGPPTAEAVTRAAQETAGSVAAFLLACWQVLVYRLSGQPRVIVGVEMDGRTQEELRKAAGLFARCVPVFAQFDARQTMAEAAKNAAEELEEKALWQDYFGWDHLGEREGAAQVFPFTFAMLPPTRLYQAEGVTFRIAHRHTCFERSQAHLSVAHAEDASLRLTLRYDATVLAPEAAAALADQYRTLVEQAVLQPDVSVEAAALVSARARAQILNVFSATDASGFAPACLHELFEAQVARTPDAVALVFEDEQLTYRRLNRRANQRARCLQKDGIGPETLVGVLMERSVEQIVAVLAILKAGGAYVPIDPDYPRDRIAHLIQDSGLRVLLTQRALVERLTAPPDVVRLLDEAKEQADLESDENLAPSVVPDNLAYVIYTSGSTGTPKGCQLTHRNAGNYVDWANAYYFGDAAVGTFGFYTSLAFDFTLTSLFCTLLRGKTLHVFRQADDVATLLAHNLRPDTPIDAVKITPSHLALLAGLHVPATNVRRVIIGGEALTRRHLDLLQAMDGAFEVYNEYGPTEVTVGCIVKHVALDDQTVLIGRPIAGTRAYVVRASGSLAAPGEPGELWLAGVGVARGYRGRPGLTAERFLPDPFSDTPGARLYRTGDLVRWTPDGQVEFLGRIDQQVQIRGFRVEPGEVEAVLAGHPAVAQAVVVGRDHESDALRLVAYLTCVDAEQPSPSHLRRYLSEALPDYMIPAAYVFVPRFPLTANGKVDVRALPEPRWTRDTSATGYVPPRSVTEERLANIWSDVLGVERVGVRDNFFELGGHSLVAIQVMAHVQQAFATTLPLAVLLQHPTIEALAPLCEGSRDDLWTPLVALHPHGSKPPLFFVPGAGGNVVYLHELARLMGNDRPFYGLQSPGLDGKTPPMARVEDLAAHFIEAMRTAQPEGPYALAGHSFGAKVAFEMARQLHRAGQDVALLAIVDTEAPLPRPDAERPERAWDDATWIVTVARVIAQLSGRNVALSYEALKEFSFEQQLEELLAALKRAALQPPSADRTQIRGLVRVYQASLLADYSCPPGAVLSTRIALLRAREAEAADEAARPVGGEEDPTWGWSAYSDDPVALHVVPGDHLTMFSHPHVATLAEGLRACLEPDAALPASITKPPAS